jgi:hypothetical protein
MPAECRGRAFGNSDLTMRNLLISLAIIAIFLEISGLIWSAKEGQPSEAYRQLSQPPERRTDNPLNNGYFMMVGFAAAVAEDPVHIGFDMWREAVDAPGRRLYDYHRPGRTELRTTLDAEAAFPAWTAADPVAEFRKPEALLRMSMDRYATLLSRYERFLDMPFEDWGFGLEAIPRFEEFLLTHRLYVAAGFAESTQAGWMRLQRDMQAWRAILAGARTLSVKTAALVVLDDDIAFLSKRLMSDSAAPAATLLTMTRPFTKEEYSLRWPIQNQFVIGTSQGRRTGLDPLTGVDETVRGEEWLARNARLVPDAFRRVQHPPLSTMLETAVASQRMWDTYDMYYDLTIKASESMHSPLPKLSDVARSSSRTLVETLLRPLEFEPDWDIFSLRLMETDAKLRLASLQILLRQWSASTTVPDRLAEVGPRYYDPFTGLPMLWSQTQAMVYSVGRDHIDDGGDPHFDLAVPASLDSFTHRNPRSRDASITAQPSKGKIRRPVDQESAP